MKHANTDMAWDTAIFREKLQDSQVGIETMDTDYLSSLINPQVKRTGLEEAKTLAHTQFP